MAWSSVELIDINPDIASLPGDLQEKWHRLQAVLSQLKRVIVAYSGGVDSTLVLKVAYDTLKDNALGVISDSPSLPRSELRDALEIARVIGVRVRVVHTDELDDPNYAANSANRCYFCKSHLHDHLWELARKEGYKYIVDGTNLDDIGDFRPGQEAARERGVRSPLREAGLTKSDVRRLARHLGLPNWNKPAMACLSSRIPYGIPVTREALSRVERAEEALRALGFTQLRVRHHDRLARIEVPLEEFPQALAQRERIVAALKAVGYTYITLDLQGFRSGSSNEILSER